MNLAYKFFKFSPAILKLYLQRLNHSPMIGRLARGSFWSFLGAALSKVLFLASNILVARMLDVEGFGKLGILQSTIGMFGIFAGFGLGVTATKHVAEFRSKDPKKAGRILVLSGIVALGTGSVMALVLVTAAPWLASKTLAAPELSGLIKIGAALLFLSAMNGAQTGALAGFEAFKSIAKVNFIAGVLNFPIMVGGVFFAGLTGAAWALVASMGVNWILSNLAIRLEANKASVPLMVKGCWREARILLKFSLPAALSGIMVGPIKWICIAMLVNQPGGYVEMGIYNAAFVFHPVLLFLGNTVGRPLLPMVTYEKEKSYDKLAKINMFLTWGLSLAPAIVLLTFPEVVQLAFGEQFKNQAFSNTFCLIILYTSIVIFKQGLSRLLVVHSFMWYGFLDNLFWGVLAISAAAMLVPWGAEGLAAAFTIAYIINTIIFLPFYERMRLIPRKTIVSKEAALIWLSIISLVIINLLNCNIFIRIVFSAFITFVVVTYFRKLIRRQIS